MNKEEAIKQFKNYFPDGVEAIVLTKEDYDRQLGKLQYENIILKDRIEKAIEYIETYIDFEDSSKLDTKKELKELLDILKDDRK